MVTVVALPKPFQGHIGMIQRNALRSWTRLPGADVLLIGDDEGVADAAREVGAMHVAEVGKRPYGTPLVSPAVAIARDASQQPLLAFVNGDIILLSDFAEAISRIRFRDF